MKLLPGEYEVFDTWLSEVCPSGDAESVHQQWLESAARQEFLEEREHTIAMVPSASIDMVLHCPKCGMQHVDMPDWDEYEDGDCWKNPPHRSHLCQPENGGCGHIWRPADVPTNGVAAVKTTGKADSPIASPAPAAPDLPSLPEIDDVEREIVERYRVEKTASGFWPYCVKAGDGTMQLFKGHLAACENVRAALQTACLDGAFMARRALGARSTAAQPAGWDGAEEWEQLAWQLCAEEHGDEACNELIWEGGAIPEPWGDRWMKYEGEAKRMISLVRQFAPPAASGDSTPPSDPADGEQLWLWRNGDHFLAFRHLYPCYSPGGDPMTLGEPFGRAIFKHSHNREGKPNEQQPTDRQSPRSGADLDLQRRHTTGAGQAYSAGAGASVGHGQHPIAPQGGWGAGDDSAGPQPVPDIAGATGVLAAGRNVAQGVAVQGDPSGALRPEPEAAGQGWQPIETAPRVFSPPLSFVNHHAPDILGLWGQAFYCVCSWGGPSNPYWIDGNNRRIPFQPTHWMPRPPPPAASQQADREAEKGG